MSRVSTTTFASRSSLETVQESEVPGDGISSCSSYTDFPSLSSVCSTTPDTPSSSQTSFMVDDEPYHQPHINLHTGVAPANDWGYHLYHAESRQGDSLSLKPESVKASKCFGFSRKKSVSDITHGLAQLEASELQAFNQFHQEPAVPLTLNQIDILRAPRVSKPITVPRQQIAGESRLAALTKFGGKKRQVTGAVKIVIQSKNEEDDETKRNNGDAESSFTTIITTSTSAGGSDMVPVYGRGGAGRTAGAKMMTQIYGGETMSTKAFTPYGHATAIDNIPSNAEMSCPRGMSSASGKSGGKAFLGKICGKIGNSGNDFQAGKASNSSSSVGQPLASCSGNQAWSLRPELAASRESLATIHSCPQRLSEVPRIYGRGGFARKTASKDKEAKFEETEKPGSRTGALLSKMRKSDNSSTAIATAKEVEEKREGIPAYGRGGAGRKNKH